MGLVASALGLGLILVIIWDAFEAIVLPRRVTRRLRPTRLFYRTTWHVWSFLGRRLGPEARRETYLSFYGPLSLLLLLGVWAASLIVGFALLYWALAVAQPAAAAPRAFATALYLSGTTFFTLGLGDVLPPGAIARVLTVIEAGTGFAFLAVVIGYLPVVYQAFSRREVNVSLLDARAGSPPSAVELLRRHAGDAGALERLLHDWERWSAEFLESHLSYPVLSYYRSQHDNESWLSALTTILDASALVMVGVEEPSLARQARLTFAMARHAVVDLAQVLQTPPRPPEPERLPADAFGSLQRHLAASDVVLDAPDTASRLAELRALYEPYVTGLADRLLFRLPTWTIATPATDNWRTTAWERTVRAPVDRRDHF
jgi:ion channel